MPRSSQVVDLSGVWLFNGCSKAERKSIERRAKSVEVPAGTTVVNEGEVGTVFYFITDGKATVMSRGRKVTELGPGQYLGELTLLDRLPRSATVKAATDLTLLAIVQREFEAILKESPSTTRKLLVATVSRLRAADNEELPAIVD
jgi:CRP-like cAMP-binding protein